jgi:hypothetical protein
MRKLFHHGGKIDGGIDFVVLLPVVAEKGTNIRD